jgi:hypothetical protein
MGCERSAQLDSADVRSRCTCLETGPHTRLQCLDLVSNLDNDASALVSCALCSQSRHLWQGPIVQHEVDIAMANAGRVQLDQDISWSWVGLIDVHPQQHTDHTWLWSGNVLHFNMEIWTFIHNYTTLARLWDIECLDLVVCHSGVVSCSSCSKVRERYDGEQRNERGRDGSASNSNDEVVSRPRSYRYPSYGRGSTTTGHRSSYLGDICPIGSCLTVGLR